jgi:glycosyltransferase involved in cell wall biosynthesis
MTRVDFDVFCVGGEPQIEQAVRDSLPPGVNIQRVVLSDHDLSLAYAGAAALVYPSLYEGFGMPVIEAMASGCPVITTRHGSLAEASGDAALSISGTSVPEMVQALTHIQDPAVHADLRRRGIHQAARFRWEPMADAFYDMLTDVIDAGRRPETQAFLAEWQRLRHLQARVDEQ